LLIISLVFLKINLYGLKHHLNNKGIRLNMLKRKLSKNVFLIINILLAKVGSGKFGKFNIIKHVIYMQ